MPKRNRDSFDWIAGVQYEHCPYLPKSSAADLDAAEAELRVRLPASYRAFGLRFGLGGELHQLPQLLFLTSARGYPDQSWAASVITATSFHRSEGAKYGVAPADFLRHAVVFGINGGDDTFLFHTGEVTNPAPEYRVYAIPRHEDPVCLAESFAGWLEWVDAEYGRYTEYEADWRQGIGVNGYRLVFDPPSFDEDPMPYWKTALHRDLL